MILRRICKHYHLWQHLRGLMELQPFDDAHKDAHK